MTEAEPASAYRSGFTAGMFDDRSVLVTGGGSGIGRCIAHELASLGATVALVGRTATKLEAVRDEIVADGGQAVVASCDIRDEGGVTAMVAHVLGDLGGIDGLVHSAGGQFPAHLRDISLNGWNAVVANNLTGTFLVAREVYRQAMEASGGAIVTIGADFDPSMPGMGHNGAARAGQANFVATASAEWAHAGVRVNHVIPGYIATTGLDTYPADAHETLRRVRRRIPMQRHGREAEVSAAAVFLLSPLAAYITGATLRVDGGLHNNVGGFGTFPTGDPSPEWDAFHRSQRPDILADD